MSDDTNRRDERGRFADGNPGGPGRPRRATEVVYMRAFSDVLTPEAWRDICETAVNAARDGDAKAREWVARYALGAEPMTLHALAVMDAHELQPIDLVEAEAELSREDANMGGFPRLFGRPTLMIAAIQRQTHDVAARQAERDRAERRARQEKRATARITSSVATGLNDTHETATPPGDTSEPDAYAN